METIKHFSHEHPLLLTKFNIYDVFAFGACALCFRFHFSGNANYVCGLCKYYIHQSCAKLAQQIIHSFHPSHPLTLQGLANEVRYSCDSCHRFTYSSPFYKCDECDFIMDKECALMPPITFEGQEHIQRSSHQHPILPLVQMDNKDLTFKCSTCHKTCIGLSYACKKCEYFLHKSCGDLLEKIQHPSHPNHPIVISCPIASDSTYYNLCHVQYCAIAF